MNARPTFAEKNEAAEFDVRARFQRERRLVLAGDKRATRDACNSLLEYLANSADLAELIRTSLGAGPYVVGKKFTDLVVAVMHTDAELSQAIAVAAAKDAPENCLPRTRSQAVALERMQV